MSHTPWVLVRILSILRVSSGWVSLIAGMSWWCSISGWHSWTWRVTTCARMTLRWITFHLGFDWVIFLL